MWVYLNNKDKIFVNKVGYSCGTYPLSDYYRKLARIEKVLKRLFNRDV